MVLSVVSGQKNGQQTMAQGYRIEFGSWSEIGERLCDVGELQAISLGTGQG